MSQIGMSSVNKAYRRRRFEQSRMMLDKIHTSMNIMAPWWPLTQKNPRSASGDGARQHLLKNKTWGPLTAQLWSDMSDWASLLNAQALLSTESAGGDVTRRRRAAEAPRGDEVALQSEVRADQWGRSRMTHQNDSETQTESKSWLKPSLLWRKTTGN